MNEDNYMTLGEFREYTKNFPDSMEIYLHDSNYCEPVPIIGIHQRTLVDIKDNNHESLSIILEVLEIEIDEHGEPVA